VSRREVPFSPIPTREVTGRVFRDNGTFGADHVHQDDLVEPRGVRLHDTRPDTPFQALLEAAPFEDVDWSREELLPLRDVIQDAIDEVLTERERFIFDAIAVERLSLRGLGAITSLSKSQVDRIYKGALVKLRSALEDHHLVKEYLTR